MTLLTKPVASASWRHDGACLTSMTRRQGTWTKQTVFECTSDCFSVRGIDIRCRRSVSRCGFHLFRHAADCMNLSARAADCITTMQTIDCRLNTFSSNGALQSVLRLVDLLIRATRSKRLVTAFRVTTFECHCNAVTATSSLTLLRINESYVKTIWSSRTNNLKTLQHHPKRGQEETHGSDTTVLPTETPTFAANNGKIAAELMPSRFLPILPNGEHAMLYQPIHFALSSLRQRLRLIDQSINDDSLIVDCAATANDDGSTRQTKSFPWKTQTTLSRFLCAWLEMWNDQNTTNEPKGLLKRTPFWHSCRSICVIQ